MKKNTAIIGASLVIIFSFMIRWGYQQQAKEQGLRYATQAFFVLQDYTENKPAPYLTPGLAIAETKKVLKEVKKSGTDVSALESRLPALKIKAWRVYAEKTLINLQDYTKGKPSGYISANSILRDVRDNLAKAREAGANVSDLEEQIPALEPKAWRLYAERTILTLQDYAEGKPNSYLSADSIISDTRETFAKAKEGGADVSELEANLPRLEEKARERN
jgi:molybdopterin converting factor small subunit